MNKDLFGWVGGVEGVPFQDDGAFASSQVFYSAGFASSGGRAGGLDFLQIILHAPTVGSRVEVDIVPVVAAGGNGDGDNGSL